MARTLMSRRGSSVQAFFEAVGSQLPPSIPIQNKKNFKRKSKDQDSLNKEKNHYYGREYSGPNVDDLVEELGSKEGKPAFIVSDGRLFDIQYAPLENYLSLQATDSRGLVLPSYPDSNKYETFFDYEEAIKEWKRNVEAILANVQLPEVAGRHYYRPFKPKNNNLRNHKLSSASEESLTDDDGSLDMIKRKPSDMERRETLASDERKDTTTSEEMTPRLALLTDNVDATLRKQLSPRISDVDPWDSLLYPPEPNPINYNKYLDFEQAMKRWALQCCRQPVPPHSTQLQNLIDLISIREIVDSTGNSNSNTSLLESHQELGVNKDLVRTGITLPHLCSQDNLELIIRAKVHTTEQQITPIRGTASKLNIEEISSRLIEPIFLRRIINWENTKSFNKSLLPKLHGVLPKKYEQNKTINEQNTLFKLKSLRRLDLNENLKRNCIDCPAEVNGIRTEVDYLDPELYVSISKLKESLYLEEITSKFSSSYHSHIFDSLNSWYLPNYTKQFNLKMEEALKLVQTHANNFTIEELRQVLWIDVPLDLFQDMLLLDSPDERVRHCSQIFLNCLTVESYPKFVCYLTDTNSQLIQAKFAAIIAEAFQSNKSKDILENLINKQDLPSLYNTALAMSLLGDKPTEVFPYQPLILELSKKNYGQYILPILRTFLLRYYLEVICKPIFAQSFAFVTVYQFARTVLQKLAVDLCNTVKSSPKLIADIFAGMSNRSSSISSFFLFICIQVMKLPDKGLVTTDEIDIINHVRVLATSKFTHTQFAAKRIFEILLEDEWLTYPVDKYSSIELLCQDLFEFRSTKYSLMSSLVTDLCMKCLRKAKEDNLAQYSFILNEALFRKLVNVLQKSGKDYALAAESVSSILAELSRSFAKFKLVKANDNIKTMKKGRTSDALGFLSVRALQISPSDITDLINIIYISDEKNYTIRNNVLNCLRHLLKLKDVFEFIRKETQFYLKIVNFCKESKHKDFNRTAWKLFYQIIKYHPGIIDDLVKSKVLGQFLDILSTSSGNSVITNGLYYLSKLFHLGSSEGKHKEESKSYEKEIKVFVSFFMQRHQFIKIHMIYKRFMTADRHSAYPISVTAFQELARFYRVIAVEPICHKILKDVLKNPEYKDGLIKIASIHGIKID